ncbi:MAG: UDP-2,4-diacetamido-2,4,6-trideoxy-beta-L-altropyranose hydrolase [Desulfobacterota bacterium]|jgi:UDP-2,4-diacetamido-2,4,6-trideoxy-beta-L-altropyranose hydrolase|nr:UDP-2,4-diacetamido-2,4,6-trideoxy-beta-L-altropyranose hydrolase [Thermodesulfobacteriota bacterium]
MREHRENRKKSLGLMLIRADASATLGSGHVMRCLALAQAWRRGGGTIAFVSACESAAVREQILARGFPLHDWANAQGKENDPAFLRATLEPQRSESAVRPWVCLDGYHFDASHQRAFKEKGFGVLVIDDMGDRACTLPDILLNQNLHAETLSYSCGPGTTLLLGSRYALIREEFREWKDWERPMPEKADKVLVTVGGGDSPEVLEKIVAAISRVHLLDLEVVVIAGSAAERLEAQVNSGERKKNRFRFLAGTSAMPQLMAWADVAVSAAGSTCWELCYMGLPSLVGILADNQEGIAQGLGDKGVALNLGWFHEVDEEEIARSLVSVLTDEGRRKEMGRKGKDLIDGSGARRVCDQIAAKDGKGA